MSSFQTSWWKILIRQLEVRIGCPAEWFVSGI